MSDSEEGAETVVANEQMERRSVGWRRDSSRGGYVRWRGYRLGQDLLRVLNFIRQRGVPSGEVWTFRRGEEDSSKSES